MFARLLAISTSSILVLSACATSQENPNYQHSTKYKSSTPYTSQTQTTVQPATYVQTQAPAPVSYTSGTYPASQYHTVQSVPVTYSRTNHECLKKEKNRELLGGAVGGTVGAIAGNKLIGGTKGTVVGAVVGGAAGYGIGDKSIDCDPIHVTASQPVTTPAQYYPVTTVPTQPAPTYQAQQPVYTAPTDLAYGDTYGTPGYHAVQAANNVPQPVAVPQPQPVTVVQPQPVQPAPVYYQPVVTPVAAPVSVPVQTLPGNGQVVYHEVIEGDTVYSLSKRQCVRVEDIQRLNGLNANFNIRLGDYIQLPASRC